MKLRDFLEENEMKMDWFATKVGVSAPTIYNICTRDTEPSLSVATKIEELTLGKVSCMDLSHHKYRPDSQTKEKPKQRKKKQEITHEES